MAYSAKHFTLFLLISLLSTFHSHARESQFFNKIPSTTNNNVVPNKEATTLTTTEEEPTFVPQNENGYGLYGHETGQLPPSTTTTTTSAAKIPYNAESEKPISKYLPKNYNPVAYVTEPENIGNTNSFTEESYNTRSTSTNNNNNNNYNNYENYRNGGYGFNERSEGLSSTRFSGGTYSTNNKNNREDYYNNGGRFSNLEPQGMSDTRLVENGRYHYNIHSGKYSSNHPYESLKEVRGRNEQYDNNKNNFGNNYENNNKYYTEGQYQNEFQNEQDIP